MCTGKIASLSAFYWKYTKNSNTHWSVIHCNLLNINSIGQKKPQTLQESGESDQLHIYNFKHT